MCQAVGLDARPAMRQAAVIHALPADTAVVDMDVCNQAVAKTLEFITRRGDYLAVKELLYQVR